MYELTGIEVSHQGRRVLAIQRLTLAENAFTVILGHNGSGKSTLMGLLARQQSPTLGEIRLEGRPLSSYSQRKLARMIAYLPQRLPEVAGLNVRELCGLGRFPWRGALGRWRPEDHRAVDEALEQTGMSGFAEQLVDDLSGGERQRAWIAMLLAQQAPILLLDEPLSALDITHQLEVLILLRELNTTAGRGILLILHDVNLAARFASRVIALKAGRVVFDAAPERLMEPVSLREIYGVEFDLIQHPRRQIPVAVLT
ncbi:MAG: ABC transporter ATP-binding protein [Candidatus Competibacteraceae bacterium]|nr:ABC transporter ATP-binding protein [Candidatus Competibacteraceae bacterium]